MQISCLQRKAPLCEGGTKPQSNVANHRQGEKQKHKAKLLIHQSTFGCASPKCINVGKRLKDKGEGCEYKQPKWAPSKGRPVSLYKTEGE